jgi:1-acyl-sn-glycerol-3-phosphate acyltransferase
MAKLKKFSLFYRGMEVYVSVAIKCFYRHIVVRKLYPIPSDKPIIYCANHQNAFMDALLIAMLTKTQPASLVRADVFKNSILRKFLTSLKMMPAYRMVDGIENINKNSDVFNRVSEYLNQNGTIIIFPEGNHAGKKYLRPLKKGVARIGFSTLEKYPNLDDIYVLPIGLEYSNHQNFRSSVVVEFGEPISFRAYLQKYKEYPAHTLHEFNAKLHQAISSHMLDIQNKRKYGLIHKFLDEELLTIHRSARDFELRFKIAKKLVRELNTWEDERLNKEELYKWFHSETKWVKHFQFKQAIWLKIISFIATIPWLPAYALSLFITKVGLEDKQFISSIKLAAALIVFPLHLFLMALLLTLFFGLEIGGIAVLSILASFPISLQFWNK